MKAENYSMDWLDQPGVYQANRLESVSSFQYIIPDRKTSQSLNGDWLVYCSNTVSGRFAGFYHEDAQTSFFQTVHVPGHLQLQGYGKVQYTGKNFPWESREILRYGDVPKRENLTACYVKNFDLDPKLASGFVKLFFHGVDSAFYVWLNGQFVGYSEDSASPAAFDVTDLLRTRNNRLCVQVHQYCSGSWLENQDAMRFAGIYGDVTLQGYPKNRIEDLKITTDIGDDLQKARILLEMKSSSQDCSYLVRFKDREDNLLLGFETKHTLVAMDVAGIHLWSAEEPYLYTLEIDVLNSDMETVQSIVQKVGLRKIRMEDGIMKINGKRIVFHGINLNEFSRQTGRVISREEMIRYIRFLKQNNINAVRTSQLPLYEEWYDLCDEYGLYVMDEVNLCTNDSRHNPKGMKVDEFFPGGRFAWKAPVLDRAASLYHRHRNHPCVLIWSLGKDSSVGNVILEEAGYLRQQDPGRLLHYEGCWNHLTYHSCSDFLSRKNLTPEECEEILELKPGRPLILCEYSSLLGNAAAGLDKFARLEKYDLYQGGFLSGLYQQVLMDSADGKDRCGADFGVFPNGGHDCAKGLLFADGKPTPAVQAVKYHFQDFAITPGKYGVKIENNSLFTPLSDYEIRYFLHQEGKLIQQGVLEAEVLPGQQKKLFIDWDKCSKESVKTVSLHLKKDTGWAKAGHEVAFGQSVQGTWSSPEARKSDMEIVETPGCVYFEDQGFSACFTSNGLESVKYDSHEMLAGVPRPVFARAFTDNDRLSGFDLQASQWVTASLFSKIRKMETVINEESRYAMVSYFYDVPIIPGAECRVDYFIAAPGLIGVDVTLEGKEILPNLCQVGMEIPLKKELSTWKYYGLGPMENVADRKGGAKLGVYTGDAFRNLTPYFMPQDCGSRSGVRWMEALDSKGRGMRICMLKKPLQASLLPYSFDELQKAGHQWELEKSSRVYAVISGFQTGTGGCAPGKPASETCRLEGRRIYSYSFIMARAQQK